MQFNKLARLSSFFVVILLILQTITPKVYAATNPGLGTASTFSILSGTYTNTAGGTTINGDLGYTTPPAVNPTVNGTTHTADSTYSQAGIDQGTALSSLNSQPCTFTFAPGAIDLASDITHGPAGVYAPGIYCITGAASVGGGGTITLNGTGTFVFRMTGALNTSANSTVTVANGATACDVWWTPGAATTLGANSAFVGTDIDASGITIGSTVIWNGRALAFGGTVSTASDTINTSTCSTTNSTSNSVSSGSSNSNSSSVSSTPPCIPSLIKATPTIILSTRVSPTSISLNWGPDQGLHTFIVQYGLENGKWLYNTKVTGFSTTLNSLPINQPIWARVAATDNCVVENYSDTKLAGSPTFPNTGIGPQKQSFYDMFSHFFSLFIQKAHSL